MFIIYHTCEVYMAYILTEPEGEVSIYKPYTPHRCGIMNLFSDEANHCACAVGYTASCCFITYILVSVTLMIGFIRI